MCSSFFERIIIYSNNAKAEEIELKNIESQGKERPEITDEVQQRINEMTELIDKMRNNNIIVLNIINRAVLT